MPSQKIAKKKASTKKNQKDKVGDGDGADGDDNQSLDNLTVQQLKHRCKEEGLPVSGRKLELIKRLREKGGDGSSGVKEDEQKDNEAKKRKQGESDNTSAPQAKKARSSSNEHQTQSESTENDEKSNPTPEENQPHPKVINTNQDGYQVWSKEKEKTGKGKWLLRGVYSSMTTANSTCEQIFDQKNPWGWESSQLREEGTKTFDAQGCMKWEIGDSWTVKVVPVIPGEGKYVVWKSCETGKNDLRFDNEPKIDSLHDDLNAANARARHLFYSENTLGMEANVLTAEETFKEKMDERGCVKLRVQPIDSETWAVGVCPKNEFRQPEKEDQDLEEMTTIEGEWSGGDFLF